MKLGLSFGESILQAKKPKRSLSSRKKFRVSRGVAGLTLLGGIFLLLAFRIVHLQLVQGSEYRSLADQNRMRTLTLHAPRGLLFDRSGTPLVYNIPGFRQTDPNCTEKITCTKVLTRDEVIKRKARGEEIPNLEIDSLRQYTYPAALAHVIGYVSEITGEEIQDQENKDLGYLGGDRIGRGGIEAQYETLLKGKTGKELVEVDAQGNQLRTLGKFDPTPGVNLTLTVDAKLSQVAYEAMKDKVGAVVISVPKTGEILTIVSTPSFDPNLFTLGEDYHEKMAKAATISAEQATPYTSIAQILSDGKNIPLFNRAVSGTYPPGSTFKIITAAAGLETGKITKETQYEDTGVLRVGAFSYANWFFTEHGKTDGFVDVVTALKRSNDIYFYKAAEAVGLSDLRAMGLKFNLQKPLGIDLPQESGGTFPSDEWKRKTFGEQWYLGDTFHLGIGQGFLLTTPLQVNSWTAVIANGGTLYRPYLLKDRKPSPLVQRIVKSETVDLIRQGMQQACATGGTGWPLFQFKIKNENLKVDNRNYFVPDDASQSAGMVHVPIACKTGTAETEVNSPPHAWITAYAPIADPELVVTVLVERGGQGSDVAGPVAKRIFEEWLGRK